MRKGAAEAGAKQAMHEMAMSSKALSRRGLSGIRIFRIADHGRESPGIGMCRGKVKNGSFEDSKRQGEPSQIAHY